MQVLRFLIYNLHFTFSDLSLLQTMLSSLLLLYFLNKKYGNDTTFIISSDNVWTNTKLKKKTSDKQLTNYS